MRTTLTCLTVMLLAAAFAAPSWAADPAAGDKPAPVAGNQPPAPPAPPGPAVPEAVKEQSIYIPYSKLREVFEKEGRGVFLPYEKFQALWQAARDKTAPAPEVKPPVDALITEIENKAVVSKDVVSVTATLKIEVLKEGWTAVPLRLADVALTKATLDDQPARIVADPAGGYKLLVEKKGKQPLAVTLALAFAKAYTKAPGQNSVSFECPQAPVSKWEVRIPESGVKVNVVPLLAATEVPPAAAGAEETVVLAFVGAAPTVRVDWTPKAEGAKGLEALASAKVEQQMTLDEGVARTRARLSYEISRAELARLEVEVPADQKVVNVFDPNVREWSVTPAGETQKIAVQLFEPAKATQSLVLELEKFSADAAQVVQVPVIKALGVGRQQGVVVVKVASGLRAEAAERSGLLQLDAAELPPGLAGGQWDFSYRYAALPFGLALKVEKVQPRIVADTLAEMHLGTEELWMRLVTVFAIERAGVFRLEFDVPEGFDVRQVRGLQAGDASAVQVDAHHLEGEKKTRLVVNLSRKALGKVALEVRLHRPLREPDLLTPTGKSVAVSLPLPRVAPGTVERETGRLIVYSPESLQVNPTTSDGLRSITVNEALGGLPGTQAASEKTVLAFAYTQDPVALAVAAERRKPHIIARQLLVARIDSGVVKYEATLFYDILYSGVKSLRLDVPKDLAPEIRVVTERIRRQVIEDPQNLKDLAEGYEAWSLAGETEFLGQTQIRLAWERKIEKLDIGKSVTLAIPRLIPRDVYRAWGQIVLVKAETIDVQESTEAGQAAGLRPIDPQHDLMPGAAVPGAARALEFHEDWSLAVVATMYKLEDVKRTSIEFALVRTVVTRSDVTSVQALYRMRSARQRLLVNLPAGVAFDTEPLRLNGRPVSLERGDASGSKFFVPLVGVGIDEPFLLELRYTVAGAGLALTCPDFPEEPAVQKVYLAVYLPQEWRYLGSRGPWTDELIWRVYRTSMRPVARLDLDDNTLIRGDPHLDSRGHLMQGLSVKGNVGENFPTDGTRYLFSTLRPPAPPDGVLRITAVDGDWFAGGILAGILAVGVALMFTRAAVRLIAAGGFVVLVVLAGVFCPTFAWQFLGAPMAAAVFVVLVLWALWYLLVTRPRDPRAIARRQAREAALQAAAQARAAAPKPPTAPAAAPTPPQPPTAPSPPSGDAGPGKADKGGPSHA